jgi:3,4-dihydroxy 2-butanone 4-phosphate synthase/GTP cyclohydrolase II
MSTLSLSNLDEIAPGWGQRPSPALASVIAGLHQGLPIVIGHRRGASLVVTGISVDPVGVAALVRHGSGLIYVAMEQQRLLSLQIPRMPTDPDSLCPRVHVAVDAAIGIGTGISAVDRAETIRRLADPASTPDTFSRPGHVLPVTASTELSAASDDADIALVLVQMAGTRPAVAAFSAVVSVDEPASMAGPLEAAAIAASCGYPYIDGTDVISAYYRCVPLQHPALSRPVQELLPA